MRRPFFEVVHHVEVDHDFPDTGVVCCMGCAVYGPGRCTCWEPVYDTEQHEPDLSAPPVTGRECCEDCAFRLDSPERAGADGYQHNSAEELREMVESDRGVFYCHQGMRRILKWVHPPTGKEVEAHPAEYRPAIVGMQAFRADGQPATVCAGFMAESRRMRT